MNTGIDYMQRREFVTLLGGAAAAWPIAARAQQMPVIGLLGGVSPESYTDNLTAFFQGLKEAGYVEGQNLRIEQRWARGQLDQLPALLADLIGRRVSVLFTTGGTSVATAAKKTGTAIPIVFALGSDPVEDGLVASMNRPGGNITGVTFFNNLLLAKRLEMLRETVPKAALIAVLVNPNNARAALDTSDIQAAAAGIGQQVQILRAGTPDDLDASFASMVRAGAGALLVTSDAYFLSRRQQLVVLAARHAIPAGYGQRDFVAAGGLISYGSNQPDSLRQAGVYVGRILKGTKPADLPVVQPTKFDLVINLRTAKALGLEIPAKVLALVDDVIE
jgi:putative ABC transport system substrate-binding protein